MRRRIVLVGASGVFGERLARMIARWPDAALVLAARRTGPLEALRGRLDGPAEVAAFDRTRPEDLAALRPWAVVDAAGPFQGADYGLALAAAAAGAHYVDLADGRGFVAGFEAALDAAAREAGTLAVTGASSTPALSHAALDRLTDGWTRIDAVRVAISPGARAPRGKSVVRAILSWTGRPVRVFVEGRWTMRPGWSLTRRVAMPGLGRRWVSLAETPDLDLLAQRLKPRREALFRAGLELALPHLGLWLLSWPVRLGLVRSLEPLAGPLGRMAGLFAPFGSDRGGMTVEAEGLGADGQPRHARWALWAEAGAGPSTPAAPAAAVLRALLDGRLGEPGAGPCVGLVGLDDIVAELGGLPIRTRIDEARPSAAGLFPRLLGPAFEALPAVVREVHQGAEVVRTEGRTAARGSAGPAALVRAVLGLPARGRHAATVEIAPRDGGEVWTRRFGKSRFASLIRPVPNDPGAFEETVGAVTFRFRAEPCPGGFAWAIDGWRFGPLPLPRTLAPTIRARTFARDGAYRFSVLAAHPLAGVLFAYAGRLARKN